VPVVGAALYNRVTSDDTLPSDIHRPTKHIAAATAASAADIDKYIQQFISAFIFGTLILVFLSYIKAYAM